MQGPTLPRDLGNRSPSTGPFVKRISTSGHTLSRSAPICRSCLTSLRKRFSFADHRSQSVANVVLAGTVPRHRLENSIDFAANSGRVLRSAGCGMASCSKVERRIGLKRFPVPNDAGPAGSSRGTATTHETEASGEFPRMLSSRSAKELRCVGRLVWRVSVSCGRQSRGCRCERRGRGAVRWGAVRLGQRRARSVPTMVLRWS